MKHQHPHYAAACAFFLALATAATMVGCASDTDTDLDTATSIPSSTASATPAPTEDPDNAEPDPITTPTVEYHTADEVLTMYHLLNLDQDVATSYSVQPDLSGLTTSGSLSSEVQQNALDTLNFTRYIAGVPYCVTLDESYAQSAQDAAFALALIGEGPDHEFAQPSWMSDSLYSAASLGAYYGNLSAGISDLATNVIHGWLSDEGENNLATLGHRRAALSPTLTATGFGLVYTSNANYNAYSSMSTLGNEMGGDEFGICWPAQTMPVEYFGDNYPWSFTVGSPVTNGTVVTVTRVSDGKTWVMEDDYLTSESEDGYITINNDYYSQPGCIIFMPYDITYAAGDVFEVQLEFTATTHYTINYTVTFISLDDEYEIQSHVSIDPPEEEDSTQEIEEEATLAPTFSGDISTASAAAQSTLSEAEAAGYPVTLYGAPYTAQMTRGQFAYMLGLFCEMKWNMDNTNTSTRFTDLSDDDADAARNKYISILYNWGVLQGTTATTFSPDSTITREEVAAILLRVKELTINASVTQDLSSYADANDISANALDGMCYMVQIGAITADNDNYLRPQDSITIEEAALMCYALFG
ncbi:MAG: S-layer homology domain-containing protein [Faecalibacterium sp.]